MPKDAPPAPGTDAYAPLDRTRAEELRANAESVIEEVGREQALARQDVRSWLASASELDGTPVDSDVAAAIAEEEAKAPETIPT